MIINAVMTRQFVYPEGIRHLLSFLPVPEMPLPALSPYEFADYRIVKALGIGMLDPRKALTDSKGHHLDEEPNAVVPPMYKGFDYRTVERFEAGGLDFPGLVVHKEAMLGVTTMPSTDNQVPPPALFPSATAASLSDILDGPLEDIVA